MAEPEHFDILILGSGAGGKLLAWQMARSGRRTAVVERQWVGGSCPNVACLPSKNEIWAARVVHLARHAAQFGTATGPVTPDMAKIRQRKREMVEREIAGHLQNYWTSGADLIMGAGHFIAPMTIRARLNDGGMRILTGERIFLNVGTHAAIPSIPGLEAARPLTHIEALELDYLPRHLVVLGGGYVGLELAQAFTRFGSRVTIVEPGQRIVGREDPDVAHELERLLAAEGVRFLVGSETLEVEGLSGTEVRLTVRTPSGEQRIEGSDILVAAGRIPNTSGIGLEDVGVALDERGYIRVNERLETTAPGIWAMGECAGSPHFTHVSADDCRIIAANLLGGNRSTRDRLIPHCMFTDPPLAHVGLNEGEARRRGIDVRVARLPMAAVLRTEATDEKQGFMKVLIAESDERILGFTMIGSEAGEVMAVMQTAILTGLPYSKLRDTVIAHLTVAEGLGQLLANVPACAEQ